MSSNKIALQERYRRASDAELTFLAGQDPSDYTDAAWRLLQAELNRRGIPLSAPNLPRSSNARPRLSDTEHREPVASAEPPPDDLPLRRWGETLDEEATPLGSDETVEATLPVDSDDGEPAPGDRTDFGVQRPAQVLRAVVLLWISLALPLLGALLALFLYRSSFRVTNILALIVTFVVNALFIAFIARGHNWARLVCLILVLGGTLRYLVNFGVMFSRWPIASVIGTVQLLLQAGAMYLVFVQPGSEWFQRRSSRS